MFQIQMQKNNGDWASVSPAGRPPYQYNTQAEAERMARLCFDADPTRVRVVRV